MLCRNLSGFDTHYFDRSGFAGYAQLLLSNLAYMNSTGDTGEGNGRHINQQFSMLGNQFPIFIDRLDLERVQVIQYDKVSNEAGSDCPTIMYAKILGSVVGSKTYRF